MKTVIFAIVVILLLSACRIDTKPQPDGSRGSVVEIYPFQAKRKAMIKERIDQTDRKALSRLIDDL